MEEEQKVACGVQVPDDIEIEILSRLPVKSLLRFKCVKKSWRNLIEDPTFIAMHLNCFGNNKNNHLDFLLHGFRSTTEPLKPIKLLFGALQRAFIVGSCNGLVCLMSNLFYLNQDHLSIIHLWNPYTRKTMKLPQCHGDDDEYLVIGFGFCPKLNDYKVVKVTGCSDFRDLTPLEVQIYSLSMNSWKKITTANPGWILSPAIVRRSVFINGASHWLGQEINSSKRMLIMSFKFDDEVFREISLPNHHDFQSEIINLFNVLITEYRNLFSLIIKRNDANVYDVWMLKEYGVADSWVKQFTIEIPIPQALKSLKPIMNFENNGELLLAVQDWDGEIVWYNTTTNQIEEKPQLLILLVYGQVIQCKESLVSLPQETKD